MQILHERPPVAQSLATDVKPAQHAKIGPRKGSLRTPINKCGKACAQLSLIREFWGRTHWFAPPFPVGWGEIAQSYTLFKTSAGKVSTGLPRSGRHILAKFWHGNSITCSAALRVPSRCRLGAGFETCWGKS